MSNLVSCSRLVLAWCSLALVSCTVEPHPAYCDSPADCQAGDECYLHFCLKAAPTPSNTAGITAPPTGGSGEPAPGGAAQPTPGCPPVSTQAE
ncbi:MAG: hypothetical protein ABW321_35770, partial [Polyangiales bacterium]